MRFFGIFHPHIGQHISRFLMEIVTRPDCVHAVCSPRTARVAPAATVGCDRQLQGPPQGPAFPAVCHIQGENAHLEACGAQSSQGGGPQPPRLVSANHAGRHPDALHAPSTLGSQPCCEIFPARLHCCKQTRAVESPRISPTTCWD